MEFFQSLRRAVSPSGELDIWKVLANPEIASKIIDQMVKEIRAWAASQEKDHPFTYIGAVSPNEAFLAYNIGYQLDIPVMIIREEECMKITDTFLPDPSHEIENIIFIDSLLTTGSHAASAYKLCLQHEIHVKALFVAIFDTSHFNSFLLNEIGDVDIIPITVWNDHVQNELQKNDLTEKTIFSPIHRRENQGITYDDTDIKEMDIAIDHIEQLLKKDTYFTENEHVSDFLHRIASCIHQNEITEEHIEYMQFNCIQLIHFMNDLIRHKIQMSHSSMLELFETKDHDPDFHFVEWATSPTNYSITFSINKLQFDSLQKILIYLSIFYHQLHDQFVILYGEIQ